MEAGFAWQRGTRFFYYDYCSQQAPDITGNKTLMKGGLGGIIPPNGVQGQRPCRRGPGEAPPPRPPGAPGDFGL